MELGMIGLGRMGANMAERLVRGGHRVVGFARSPETVRRAMEKGIEGAFSLDELVQKLNQPRAVWLMLPAGEAVDATIQSLLPLLEPEEVILDGGNSYYKDSQRRAGLLEEKGLHFVDVGTSGGIWGLTEGYCMMIGGDKAVVERLQPIFESLAPTPDKGWGHVGPNGSGHFVKMVHNGIEYGIMEAYAEGFELMQHKSDFNLDLRQVAEIWRFGSVIRSWLLDLAAGALAENPALEGIAPYVADSGEGRWTAMEGIELGCPLPVITLALQNRFRSREEARFGDRLLAALRHQFGGHEVRHQS